MFKRLLFTSWTYLLGCDNFIANHAGAFLYGVLALISLGLLVFMVYGLRHCLMCRFLHKKGNRHSPIWNDKSLENGGRWHVVGHLGAGCFGAVNLVEDQTNSNLFARKEIYLNTTEKNILAKAKQEVNILKKLEHPNIVKIFYGELNSNETHFQIYMEYAKSGSLRDLLRQQIISEAKTKEYGRQLLDALKYIHSQNVIHRDIKPENILVFSNDILKLADFGVAKSFDQISVSTTVIGTPHYVSKEVWKGRYGRKTDIWSLGIVIFEMVTGKLPWENKNKHAIMYDISVGSKPDADSMPVSYYMKEFLKPMFLDENERPSAAELLRHPWLRSQNNEFVV